MKKQIIFLSLITLSFTLFGCDNTNKETNTDPVISSITLDEAITLLQNDLYQNEINSCSKVNVTETDSNSTVETVTKEEFNIYNDDVSLGNGEYTITYKDENQSQYNRNDSYVLETAVQTIDDIDYFVRVMDYDKGDYSSFVDSAYRIPILEEEDPNLIEGSDYLLKNNVKGQLAKQVSYSIANFIITYLVNNPDLASYVLPSIEVTTYSDHIDYIFKDFTYSYQDDEYDNRLTYSFSFTTDLNKTILSGKTSYLSLTSRIDDPSDNYSDDLINEYSLSYDEKVSSSTNSNILDPDDYFLASVSETQASNSDGTTIYQKDNLPLNTYIWFNASKYSPAKAIDLLLRPVSSSDETVIEINEENIFTVGSGTATVTFETVNGIVIEEELTVEENSVTSEIIYLDSSSNIENDEGVRSIYTNTQYSNIYLYSEPDSIDVSEDLYWEISDPSILEITGEVNSYNMYILTYNVIGGSEGNNVTVTFKSHSNPDVSVSITYNIKLKLSVEELYTKLTSNTYTFNSLYDENFGGELTFNSDRETFDISFNYGIDNETISYCYTLNETTFNLNITRVTTPSSELNEMTAYNSGEISFDGEEITFRVNDTDFVHHFYIEG